MPRSRPQLNSILILIALVLVVSPVRPASASTASGDGVVPLHRAGLIVQHGNGTMTYAVVAFPEETISGIELLQRSGIEYLSVPFGGLGEGVCQIEREGCEATECRRTVCQATRSSPYWQYLDQTADRSWRAAPLGASGSKVSDGDVLAWSWSAGPPSLPGLDLPALGTRAGLDPVQLASLGQQGHLPAVVRSGVMDVGDALYPMTLLGGVLAVTVVAGVGCGLLVRRRRQIARL